MKLIDEVKKLRDECRKEETYYNERFNLWMKYKGESWPELPSRCGGMPVCRCDTQQT